MRGTSEAEPETSEHESIRRFPTELGVVTLALTLASFGWVVWNADASDRNSAADRSRDCVLRVTSEVATADEVVLHFSVKDTGVGIPQGRQRAIVEAFTQADGSVTRRYGGTGLGLTISSQLVQLMGGRLWVESEAGRSERREAILATLGVKPARCLAAGRDAYLSKPIEPTALFDAVDRQLLVSIAAS